MEMLKVSSNSNPGSVAGVISEVMKTQDKIEIQVIGAGAVNQAIKAIAIARGFVAPLGIDLICIPAFTGVEIEDETRTGIKLIIKK